MTIARLYFLAASACLVGLCLVITQPSWLFRASATAFSTLATFFVGIGIGERSNAQFLRDVMRANEALAAQNLDLRELNLQLLRQLKSKTAGL